MMLQQINTQRDQAFKVDKQTDIKSQWINRKADISLKWTPKQKNRQTKIMFHKINKQRD